MSQHQKDPAAREQAVPALSVSENDDCVFVVPSPETSRSTTGQPIAVFVL